MRADTNTTIFAFASPQLLATYDYVRNAIVGKCRRNGTLRSITIDEAHLFAQHGASLREEVRHCCLHVFKAARKNVLGRPLPFYLLVSATMSLADMTSMSSMTDIGFDEPQYVIRGTPEDFAQESITMLIKIGDGYTREVDRVVSHLHNKTEEVDDIGEIKHFLPRKIEIEFGAAEVDDEVPLACFELVLELNKRSRSRAGVTVSRRVLYCCFDLNKVNPSQLCLPLNEL